MPSENYLKWGIKTVEGWLHPLSAQFIAGLSTVQRKLDVVGSVGEIGVHHGKLFILLHADADTSRSFAIDVFDDQSLNLDQSGKGSYKLFTRNVERWCGPIDDVEIIKRSSLDVRPSDLKNTVGEVRLFSIDGGHTEECTINDIRLAEKTICDRGVVILDDVFNPQWPGVMTGLAKYLIRDDSVLHPFAFTPNKVYLSKSPAADTLKREMALQFRKFWDKDSLLFGSTVDVYGIYELNDPIKHNAKRILEQMGLLRTVSAIRVTLSSI